MEGSSSITSTSSSSSSTSNSTPARRKFAITDSTDCSSPNDDKVSTTSSMVRYPWPSAFSKSSETMSIGLLTYAPASSSLPANNPRSASQRGSTVVELSQVHSPAAISPPQFGQIPRQSGEQRGFTGMFNQTYSRTNGAKSTHP